MTLDTLSPTASKSAARHDPVLNCNGGSLRRANRRMTQLYDSVLAPCGLRATQRSILSHVDRLSSPNMGELADALILDRGALAHNLKPLERDGLLVVTPCPNDKRNRLVRLTAAGKAKLDESTELWKLAQYSFETAYGIEQAAALRAALDHISSPLFTAAFNNALHADE